jgi:sigma-B regulation protein RsbU (phosphoserine phosphatase)
MSDIPSHPLSLAQVRHDMRTPLNHILGFSELLAEEADTIKPPELKSDLDKIQTAAKNLLGLIDTHLSEDGVRQLVTSDTVAEPAPSLPPMEKITPPIESGDAHDPVARVSGRILVVDDNPANCETLSRRLNKQGHETAVAHHGEAALGILRAEKFDLVLLDILMPGIDGYAVLQEMKSDHALRHIPVIMISALDEIDSVVHCIESGAEDYLSKPFNPTLLRARIGASLEKKALRDDEQRHLRVIEETQERLKHELDEAARYVRSIIPEPITTPVQIDWRYIPSTELGGDAFGYHMINDSHLAIYLLDVCGHGVGASLLSVTAMNVIRSGSLAGTNFLKPSEVLFALNEAFPMERQNNMYFTIWYGVYDTVARVLTHASGGHPPALLFDGTRMTDVRAPGLLIGAMEGAEFQSESMEVAPGAELFVFSDGVYEVKNTEGGMVSFEDFRQVVMGVADTDVDLDCLIDWARDCQGSAAFEDDYSLMRIRF